MRKFLVLVATWFALCGSVVVAQQILPGFPPGAFSNKAATDPAPGGGGTTTFDPSNTGSNNTLSNGNLTVVTNVNSDNGHRVGTRTVASHSTGAYYVEYTLGSDGSPGNYDVGIGLANSSATLTDNTYSVAFSDANSGATYNGDANFYINNGAIGTATTFAPTNIVSMWINAGSQLYAISVNGGNWNANASCPHSSSAPTACGISFSAITGTGPYYAAIGLDGSSHLVSVTANFGATSYTYTVPTGASNW